MSSRRTPLLLALPVLLAVAGALLWVPGSDAADAGGTPSAGTPAAAAGAQGGAGMEASGTADARSSSATPPPAAAAQREDLPPPAAEDDGWRLVTLLLRDPGDRPIADAPLLGRADGLRSDAAGRVPLRLLAVELDVRVPVAVPGYLPRQVTIPGGHRGELAVVLQPTTLLEIVLEPAPGARAEEYEFCFSLAQGVHLQRGDAGGTGLERLLHPYEPGGFLGDPQSARDWYWQASPRAQLLTGMPVGEAAQLWLLWRGLPMERRTLAPFTAGERRVERFLPGAVPLRRVAAVDAGGAPLRAAELRIRIPSANGMVRDRTAPTALDGAGWLLPDLHADDVEFRFVARGHGSRRFLGQPPAQVVLEAAATLTVRLAMEDGTAVPPGVMVTVHFVDEQGVPRTVQAIPLTPVDAPFFPELPHGVVEVRAGSLSVEPVETLHDVRSGELRLVLRRHE